jgi:ABC-type nitrate/sulfonate/bicarbonate transport system permease component
MIASQSRSTKLGGALLLGALLAAWQVMAAYWTDSPSWPPLTAIAASLVAALRSGELPAAFGQTVYVMVVGYAIGVAGAIVLGLAMAKLRAARAVLNPWVELLRPIPISAMVPPLILLLGLDDALKIFAVGFSVFFPVLVNTVAGVRAIDPVAIDVGRTLRVGRLAMVRSVLLPATLPYILAGMRISLPLALIVAVTAEMISGSAGIGYYLITMQYAMRPADMYAAVFLLAFLGYVLNAAFLMVERRLLHWYHVTP